MPVCVRRSKSVYIRLKSLDLTTAPNTSPILRISLHIRSLGLVMHLFESITNFFYAYIRVFGTLLRLYTGIWYFNSVNKLLMAHLKC